MWGGKSMIDQPETPGRSCHRGARIALLVGLSWLAGLGLPRLEADAGTHRKAVGSVAQGEVYTARLAAAQATSKPGGGKIWQYTFEVENRKTHAASQLLFGGKAQALEDELEWFGVSGDRLVATTAFGIAVFSLAGNRLEENLVAAGPVPSLDGTQIAYLALHPRGSAKEDSGSVVAVLDLTTMARRYVFPAPDRVTEVRNGPDVYPEVTEPDPAKQHQVLKLFWAPDGARLVFFCRHGFPLLPAIGPMYIVVVDPRPALKMGFVHQALEVSAYRKKGAPAGVDTIHFIEETVTWPSADTISVHARGDFPWVKDPFVLKLPAVPGSRGR